MILLLYYDRCGSRDTANMVYLAVSNVNISQLRVQILAHIYSDGGLVVVTKLPDRNCVPLFVICKITDNMRGISLHKVLLSRLTCNFSDREFYFAYKPSLKWCIWVALLQLRATAFVTVLLLLTKCIFQVQLSQMVIYLQH